MPDSPLLGGIALFRSRRAATSRQSLLQRGRHRLAGRASCARAAARRPIAFVLVPLLVAAVAVVGGVATTAVLDPGSAGATTLPGQPGTPQARTVLFDEGFQNTSNGGGLPLANYTGTAGDTFTANPYYLDYTECNGVILYGTEQLGGSICSKYANPPQLRINAENSMRGQATALGGFNGLGSSNRAVSFLTANLQIPPNLVELETANPATVPGLTGKFIGFSINSAEVCSDGLRNFVQPSFQLFVKTPAVTAVTGGVNPCQVYGGAGITNGSVAILATNDQIGFRVVNLSGGGLTGNDMGLDDFTVWDETPQLDKSFSPTSVPVNGQSTATFTITNTSELSAKSGWSFTDKLPSGLVTATSPTPASTTCPTGTVSASGDTVSITNGSLSAGMKSCTVTVNVTSSTAGTYTITVTNTGNVAYSAAAPVTVTDDLTKVLDDAVFNPTSATALNGTTSAGTLTYAKPTLTWTGPLAVGAVVTISYTVTVNSPDNGDLQLVNGIVTSTGGNCLTSSSALELLDDGGRRPADRWHRLRDDHQRRTRVHRRDGRGADPDRAGGPRARHRRDADRPEAQRRPAGLTGPLALGGGWLSRPPPR